jgi:preprotein translocase subunit YajC
MITLHHATALASATIGALPQDAPSLAGAPIAPAPAGTTAAPGGIPGPQAAPGPDGSSLLLIFMPIVLLYLILMIWGARRERKAKQKLLESVKKHDRVQTVGGVIGSVVELKPDIVVLKVDETSNTRVTFLRSAIVSIMKEAPAPAADAGKDAATAKSA